MVFAPLWNFKTTMKRTQADAQASVDVQDLHRQGIKRSSAFQQTPVLSLVSSPVCPSLPSY